MKIASVTIFSLFSFRNKKDNNFCTYTNVINVKPENELNWGNVYRDILRSFQMRKNTRRAVKKLVNNKTDNFVSV